MNRIFISTTLGWLLSFMGIVGPIAPAVVVVVGLIPTIGLPAVVLRVTITPIAIHIVSSRLEEGVERGFDGPINQFSYRSFFLYLNFLKFFLKRKYC